MNLGSLGAFAPIFSLLFLPLRTVRRHPEAMRYPATLLILCGLLTSDGEAQVTELISVSSSGQLSNGVNTYPSVSRDGRFVVFESTATTLVPGDTNGRNDIFLRDTLNSTTTRISLTVSGQQASGHSTRPSISADGRYVFFFSRASNLYAGASGSFYNLYRYDRATATLEAVSKATDGTLANNQCEFADFSSDGRFAVFVSHATNLVPDDTNGVADIFLRDMDTQVTKRVSMGYLGNQAQLACANPSVSDDGVWVVFDSTDDTLAFDDTNNARDVFLRNVISGTTIRASVMDNGQQVLAHSYDPILSADGGSLLFVSDASFGLASRSKQVFHKSLTSGAVTLVSVNSTGQNANHACELWEASGDLRFVLFQTTSTNLQAGATGQHAYVHDRLARRTARVSRSTNGDPGASVQASLGERGDYVVFSSVTQLDPSDTNALQDIYRFYLGDVRPTLKRLILEPSDIRGGNVLAATAELNGISSIFGCPLEFESTNPTVASVLGTIEVEPGSSSTSFDVQTSGVDSDLTVTLRADTFDNSVQEQLLVRRARVQLVATDVASIVGGNTTQGKVTLEGEAGPQSAFVRLTDNSSSLLMSNYCIVQYGQREAVFKVWTYGVSTPTTVVINAYFNGATSQTSTLLIPAALDLLWLTPTQVIGGNPTLGNLRLNGKAPLSGITATLSSSDPSVASTASSTTLTYGSHTKQFPVSTFGVDSPMNITIQATADGVSRTAGLQVRPATLGGVTVDLASIRGGTGTTGRVHMTGKTGPKGRTILLSSNRSEVMVPTFVFVPAQRVSWAFAVNSTAVASTVYATITASQGGISRTAELAVTP